MNKIHFLRVVVLICVLSLLVGVFSGCSELESKKIKKQLTADFGLDVSKTVALNMYGNMENFKAIEDIIIAFNEMFPNCTITYSNKEDYDDTMLALLKNESDTKSVSLYMTHHAMMNTLNEEGLLSTYATDFYDEANGIDTGAINKGFSSYYEFDGKLYDVPSMINARGMVVNKTLLAEHGLEIPQTLDEFLNCCAKLKSDGLIPIQCGVTEVGVCMIYPRMACDIVYNDNSVQILESTNAFTPGSGEYFRDDFDLLKQLCNEGYYSYEECKDIVGNYNQAILNFFEGDVAFYPCTIESFSGMEKREIYTDPELGASKYDGFEYEYIGTPVGNGQYIYYMPFDGIAVNPQCDNNEWARAFANFLFREENLTALALSKGMYANTNSNTDPDFNNIAKIEAPYFASQDMFTITYFSELKYTFEKIYKKEAKVCDADGNLDSDLIVNYFEGKIASKLAK